VRAESFAVLVEYGAQARANKAKAKFVFLRKLGDLCFEFFQVWRAEALQFVFVNSAVLVCAKVQFAFDLTRERFHIPLSIVVLKP